MPIEFRCTQCGKLLRTPDGSSGQMARCPECDILLTIPAATQAPTSPSTIPPGPPQPMNVGYGSAPTAGFATVDAPPDFSQRPTVTPAPFFRPSLVDFSSVLNTAWTIFTANAGLCIGAGAILFGINLGSQIVAQVVSMSNEPLMILTVTLSNMLLNFYLTLGMTVLSLKLARGIRAEITDVFSGAPFLLPGIGISFLTTMAVGAAMIPGIAVLVGAGVASQNIEPVIVAALVFAGLLLLIPGIYVALMLLPSLYMLIDQGTGVGDSLSYSVQATRGNKLALFGLVIAIGLAAGAFMLCTCGIGTIAATPFVHVLWATAYLQMTGQSTASQAGPSTILPPPTPPTPPASLGPLDRPTV